MQYKPSLYVRYCILVEPFHYYPFPSLYPYLFFLSSINLPLSRFKILRGYGFILFPLSIVIKLKYCTMHIKLYLFLKNRMRTILYGQIF